MFRFYTAQRLVAQERTFEEGPLNSTVLHGKRKQDDKMTCVQLEKVSDKTGLRSGEMSGPQVYTSESPFIGDKRKP